MCDQQRLRPACAYAQSDQSLCKSLEYSMNIKLLTEQHLEFLSFKRMLHMLVLVCTCQNTTLLEITCHGSYMFFSHNNTDNKDKWCGNSPPIRLNPGNKVKGISENDTIILSSQDLTTNNVDSETDTTIHAFYQNSSDSDTVNYSLFPKYRQL